MSTVIEDEAALSDSITDFFIVHPHPLKVLILESSRYCIDYYYILIKTKHMNLSFFSCISRAFSNRSEKSSQGPRQKLYRVDDVRLNGASLDVKARQARTHARTHATTDTAPTHSLAINERTVAACRCLAGRYNKIDGNAYNLGG